MAKFNFGKQRKRAKQDMTVSSQALASYLGVHHNTVARMVNRGELKSRDLVDVLDYVKQLGYEQAREEIRNFVSDKPPQKKK